MRAPGIHYHLKKPANLSVEERQASAKLASADAGFVHSFRSIIQQLVHSSAPGDLAVVPYAQPGAGKTADRPWRVPQARCALALHGACPAAPVGALPHNWEGATFVAPATGVALDD